MFVKVSMILGVVAFLQATVVLSQQQQQQQSPPPKQQDLIQGMTATQMWNPYSWSTPYYSAATDSWADYIKKAQEVGNQLYQQWDKSGAANWFNAGMGIAQMATSQAMKNAQEAMKQGQYGAQQGAQAGAEQGQKGYQDAMKLAQYGAKEGMKWAQLAMTQFMQ